MSGTPATEVVRELLSERSGRRRRRMDRVDQRLRAQLAAEQVVDREQVAIVVEEELGEEVGLVERRDQVHRLRAAWAGQVDRDQDGRGDPDGDVVAEGVRGDE